MLFNSLHFALFLPMVFVMYWFVANKSLRWQNLLLVVASYFFYACWDYRFLILLAFSTLLDFYTALNMEQTADPKMKKCWFWLSITVNLGILGVFKYYNFFIDSFADGLSLLGIDSHFLTLQVILPLGISFYTFHGLSYVIDIYNEKIRAEKNLLDYSLFVSFFPLLVAGPIERATHLLPQIKKNRQFNYTQAIDGLRQILWGLFKKLVIADGCAQVVNLVFDDPMGYSPSTLIVGAVLFTIQIYGDFSGYSDIAIGTARLFGFDLLRNFSFPFFSRSIAEFWRRWHISLSSWFRDYLYIPLGGSKGGLLMKIRNTFLIFIVSGFWHGANWTFIIWGLLHALYIMPSIVFGTNRNHLEIVAKGRVFPTFVEAGQMFLTFGLAVFAFIFFRADNLHEATLYISQMFVGSLSSIPEEIKPQLAVMLVFFFLMEWLGRENQYAIQRLGFQWPKSLRIAFYYALLVLIFLFAGNQQEFIYFQF